MTKRGFFLLVVLFGMLSFVSASDVFISPATSSIMQGEEILVSVLVNTAPTDLHSLEFNLTYDPAILQFNAISEGGFLGSDGADTLFNYSSAGAGMITGIYNARNTTFTHPNPGITGTNGEIVVLNFTAIGVGTSALTLGGVLWVNSSILNDSASVVVPTITSGSVTIAAAPCVFTNAYWSTSSVVEGTVVVLTLEGTNCDGKEVSFEVWEDDGLLADEPASIHPVNAFFLGNTVTTTWTSEWHEDTFTDPEYYFIGTLVEDSGVTLQSSDPELSVSKLINADALFIDPSTQTVSSGESFLVSVKAQAPVTASDIYGVQFDVTYDSSNFVLNGVFEGDMLNESGTVPTIFDYTPGASIVDNVLVLRNVTNASGSPVGLYQDEGTVAVLNFTATGSSGTHIFGLSQVIWVNSTLTNFSVGVVGIATTNGSVTISSGPNTSPTLSSLECQIGGTWQTCDNLDYGETLQSVRATCTDSDGTASSVGFVFHNTEDNTDLVSGTGTKVGDVFTYDFADFALDDSGSMNVSATCADDDSATDVLFTSWSVPWGQFVPTLVTPAVDTNYSQYESFWFNASFDCIGGECGDVDVTLDPTLGDTTQYSAVSTGSTNYRCGIYALAEDGVVDNVSWYGSTSGVSGSCAMAIYESTATLPTNLVVQSALTPTTTTAQWRTYDVTNTALTAGTYALCLYCEVPGGTQYGYGADSSGTTGVLRGANAQSYPFVSTYPGNSYSNPYPTSFYATYTTGASAISKGGAVSTTVGATPFYTTSQNPIGFNGLKGGDTQNTAWFVNASGAPGLYDFYVIYTPTQYANVLDVESAHLSLGIQTGAVVDTTPPVLSNGQPSGSLASGTTQVNMNVTTNEAATCRYATSAGVSYASMTNTFTTTGATLHNELLTGLADGSSYSYYVRCNDSVGNVNTNDFTVSFSVLTPGSSCTDSDGDIFDNCTLGTPGDDNQIVDCNDNDDTVYPGAPELCDTLDNDCDVGTVDGLDEPTYGQPTTCGVGVCVANGVMDCIGGVMTDTCSVRSPSGIAESICNGEDDDCDGSVDEDYAIDTSCFLPGVCALGNVASSCVSGVETSCQTGSPIGADDECNNIDEDCSGVADDNYVATPTSCGVGECSTSGSLQCISGTLQDTCTPGPPVSETCNGLDDDCNGVIDNDLTAPLNDNQNGVCFGFVKVCGGSLGWINNYSNIPNYEPLDELSCDALDNDCDGNIDETNNECSAPLPYCSSGSCVECVLASDCGVNGWVANGTTRWTSASECTVEGETGEEYLEYLCSSNTCSYSVTGYRWVLNGTIANVADGTLCDDGLFCTTGNRCLLGTCDSGEPVVCNDGISCSVDSCNEALDRCESDVSSCGCPGGFDSECDNGIACDGLETCNLGTLTCLSGTAVDCSGNDLGAINTCTNDPDNNPFTLDIAPAAFSTCTEPSGTCTTPTQTVTSSCDLSCGGCVVNADCDDGIAETIDTCQLDCSCTNALTCVDNDGDGFNVTGGACGIFDCNDNSANGGALVYPGATEICGDGIDQDCSGADLACTTSCTPTSITWNTTSALEGDFVSLDVVGTDCDGVNVRFYIYEKDGLFDDVLGGGDDSVVTNPLSVSFISGSAQGLWSAEWQDDGFLDIIGNPEYYFIAEFDGSVNYSSEDYGGSLLHVALAQRRYELRSIPFTSGKNSFSLPLILDNYSIDAVFSDIASSVERIYTYEGGFKVRNFNGLPSNLDTLEVGRGYIVFMNAPATLVLNGTKRDENLERPTITLSPGWNFIGTFSNSYQAQVLLEDQGVAISELYTFNNALGVYERVQPTDMLNDEDGYWIYMNQNGSFVPLTGAVIGP